MTIKDISNLVPLMPIEDVNDDCVISKKGDITFGWRIILPVAYSVNEAGYDSILQSFVQAYKLLPEYTVIHKQDIFKYDTYRAIEP